MLSLSAPDLWKPTLQSQQQFYKARTSICLLFPPSKLGVTYNHNYLKQSMSVLYDNVFFTL